MRLVQCLFAVMIVLALPARAEAPAPSFEERLLAAHNAERERWGKEPLVWNESLAQQAQAWAHALAANGMFTHARERYGAGENLWRGNSDRLTAEQMVGAFIAEKRYFRPGYFPDVSTTGDWMDVGHFTQLIWPATRQVGCAMATGQGYDVLVCRYYPAGNVFGELVR